MNNNIKIKVLLGGISSERDVSIHTGLGIIGALEDKYDIEPIYLESDISSMPNQLYDADIVFNALHGGIGENGDLQSFLDLYNIKYTGSGPKASKIAMDKNLTKIIATSNSIPTPNWIILKTAIDGEVILNRENSKKFKYPCVVKPNNDGSTMGLSIVTSEKNLQDGISIAGEYSDEIMVEEYIPGREITVGILGFKPLLIVEIIPNHGLYDYNCKYTKGMSKYICPAEIPSDLTQRIQEDALKLYNLLGCRHYARVDFRLNNKNEYYLLEINTLPGMTDTSLLPKASKIAGLSYSQLIETIIKIAMEKQ